VIELLPSAPWVRQRLLSPSVYLDHWALRRFSTNAAEGTRFTEALKRKAGTLVLSWANMAEFLAMDANTTAAADAERFIDANWPRLYFIRSEPFEVARREDMRARGELNETPEGDDQLASISGLNTTRGGLHLPSVSGLLTTVMSAKDQLEAGAKSLKVSVRDAAMLRFEKAKADPAEQAKIDKAPTAPGRARATLSAAELLLRGIFCKGSRAMEENDTFDLLHAAVPLAYCDYVLLDGKWRDLADTAIREMRVAGVTAALAAVYSGKKGQVEQFLAAQET